MRVLRDKYWAFDGYEALPPPDVPWWMWINAIEEVERDCVTVNHLTAIDIP
jgi:hypothetical protein